MTLLTQTDERAQQQVEAARRSVGKQFILITPNAIEGRAKVDKDVKIIRYKMPAAPPHRLLSH